MNVHQTPIWKTTSVSMVLTMLVLIGFSATPAQVAFAADTGWLSPSADYAHASSGFSNPSNAYADGTSYAFRNAPANGVTHVYRDYGFSIPAGAVIQGIQVRLDWWLDWPDGANAILVYLSWDGGTSWTAIQSATTKRTDDGNPTDIVGGIANTWGRAWSSSEFSNANFRVRLELSTDRTERDFRIDWVPVQVTYNHLPNTPTNQTPAAGASTTAANPTFGWSAFSDPNPADTQTAFQVQLRTQAGFYGDGNSHDSSTVASAANTYTPSGWDLADGMYWWHVRVQDSSGASNAWSAYSTETRFTVDRTAPTSAATSPDYDNAGTIPVAWTASDNVEGSGVSSVALWYRFNAGSWTDSGMSQSGTAGTFAFAPPGGAHGTYSFQTIATDAAGNVEAGPAGDGDDSTVYDTSAPISVAVPPAGPIDVSPIAIPWTADGAVSGIAAGGIRLRYSYNGGTYTDGPTASGTSGTFNFDPPSGHGTYCFYTIATDNAGNVEAPPGGANGDGCVLFTPPVAVNDSYSTAEDTPLSVAAPGVLANDSDPDGDTLTAVLVAGPANGTLALQADGSFVYTPAPDFDGVDTFTYYASDGTASSNVATVTITVTPVNDAPVAVNNSYSTAEDTPRTVAAPGVLANDSDADGDTLTAVLVAGPAGGTLVFRANGSFVYTPTLNMNGVVTFTYRASDGTASSNVATVTITVTPVNDVPVAADDSYSTAEDTPLTVIAPGVLANDTDADGDTLTAVEVAGPAGGTLALQADGSFVYTPALNYHGVVTFTYQASDGTATSNVATVTITVGPTEFKCYLPVVLRNY